MNVCSLVRKTFYCSYRLEKLVAELLNKYSEKIKNFNKEINIILKIIAIESLKHAEFINFLSEYYNLYEEIDNCSQVVGEPWIVVQELLELIDRVENIDLKMFLEKQSWLEKTVGEESYHKLLMPLLREAIQNNCIDYHEADIVKEVLDKIVVDEKWHEHVLKILLEKESL